MTKLQKWKQTASKFDENAKGDSQWPYIFLLAAADTGVFGPDELSAKTQIPRSKCRLYASNLRKNGVFKDGKIHHSGWFDKKSGGIAFVMDAALAMGYLQRTQPTSPAA